MANRISKMFFCFRFSGFSFLSIVWPVQLFDSSLSPFFYFNFLLASFSHVIHLNSFGIRHRVFGKSIEPVSETWLSGFEDSGLCILICQRFSFQFYFFVVFYSFIYCIVFGDLPSSLIDDVFICCITSGSVFVMDGFRSGWAKRIYVERG